jgi:hypothetical protein
VKYCYACDARKPESEFYKDRTRRDGLSIRCKECDRLRNREICRRWYRKHREEHIIRTTLDREKRRARAAEAQKAAQKAAQEAEH